MDRLVKTAYTEQSGSWEFFIVSFHYRSKHWVVIREINGVKTVEAWSSKENKADVDELLKRIRASVAGIQHKYDLLDAFLLSAGNSWDYWGLGIPHPIFGLVESGELDRA